ncbi:MAG: hypothetical protein S4CHLAM2_00670 [Chlamydiales bacterium]|nr:hypothetical protein [Chlamydiales bacterium]
MSGINRVKEKMKQKLTFGGLATLEPCPSEEKKGRKIYSLTKEDNVMLKKIFSTRLNLESETSIAMIMSEAIELLYSKEFPKQT